MSLTKQDLETLQRPFDEATIGIKVQSFSKDKTKAMLVAYVQHTDAYARIEEVDPAWSVKITETQYVGESCFVRVAMTIKGVTRENAGEGSDPKSATSDAIKRAAMLFGVGRYLYDADTVWVPYSEKDDRYRTYTYQEYRNAGRKGQSIAPAGKVDAAPALKVPLKAVPRGADYVPPATRGALGQEIMKARDALRLNQEVVNSWCQDEFKKQPKDLTIQEMQTLLAMLQAEAGRAGVIKHVE